MFALGFFEKGEWIFVSFYWHSPRKLMMYFSVNKVLYELAILNIGVGYDRVCDNLKMRSVICAF